MLMIVDYNDFIFSVEESPSVVMESMCRVAIEACSNWFPGPERK